ncbi:hypothetical protein KVF89_05940 [Nocardioides carbamazepini]|uniref:hypothetical protein n=1 Tax=Nocardioides carbamazepini TaxID=2854259 RepID=UPI00214A16F5|nr:hypothetical protein [Nocardioides carbamazepini]MCR1782069.1 hypothetical protein [Nocardioides carbamazepini]
MGLASRAQDEPDAVPVRYGGPRLVSLAGDGTPQVADLALVEMAIARHEGVMATRNTLADALDLRHRLPSVWTGVREGRCEVWVVRRVARMSRRLDRDQVRIVDDAVAAALDEAPSRILAIAEAKVIEADPATHAERIKANRGKLGVWYSQPRPGDQVEDPDNTAGVASIFARVERLGPRLLDQVRDLLAHHAHVSIAPVVDLHTGRSVNGYEHPTDVKHRTQLRTVGDVFPHATGLFAKHGRPPDHDHTRPYDTHGPPGQTGDHNDTPLTRHHHRAKTHLEYRVLEHQALVLADDFAA